MMVDRSGGILKALFAALIFLISLLFSSCSVGEAVVSGLNSAAQSAVSEAKSEISGALSEAVSNIGSAVSTAREEAEGAASEAIDSVKSEISGALSEAGSNIGSAVSTAISQAENALSGADDAIGSILSQSSADTTAPPESSSVSYSFRTDKLFDQHYKKHGAEFGDITKEEYLRLANALIADSSDRILHKMSSDDDLLYYDPDNNYFLVLSQNGYIRTFFRPDNGIRYWNKQ